uniref:Uncharacterized protein n=1 Tax=Oryza barthii TaxID=65489 RepID=A0A0D3FSL1_9ORYZ
MSRRLYKSGAVWKGFYRSNIIGKVFCGAVWKGFYQSNSGNCTFIGSIMIGKDFIGEILIRKLFLHIRFRTFRSEKLMGQERGREGGWAKIGGPYLGRAILAGQPGLARVNVDPRIRGGKGRVLWADVAPPHGRGLGLLTVTAASGGNSGSDV